MFGLLNIDKPPGLTSRDVVNRVQRLVKPHKAGHAGTLDPLATGVLVIALGAATRLIEYVQRLPKTYRGLFLLGRSSDTEDIEGRVTELAGAPTPSREQLQGALPAFIGTIEQRPPAYSALKVGGQRAYKLARRGDDVVLTPRPVEIFAIDLLRYDYPEFELRVRCGSGTYVRSLGRDIAQALGTAAVMASLRREAIGPFQVEHALSLDELSLPTIEQRLSPAVTALADLPQMQVTPEEQFRLARGQPIANRWQIATAEAAATSASGLLVAILAMRQDGQLWPAKGFLPDASA